MATVVGLVTAGISFGEITTKSILSLIKLIKSYRNHNKGALELQKVLESFSGLLHELNGVAAANPADSASLESPLNECSRACEDFAALISKCTAHFGNDRPSIRDWTKVMINEDEIIAFKDLINGYKSTINIKLGCINWRTSRATIDGLQKWQQTIESTMTELKELLGKTDGRYDALFRHGAFIPDTDAAIRDRLEAEKDAIKQCLAICAQGASETMVLIRSMTDAKNKAEHEHNIEILSLRRVLEAIEENQGRLGSTTSSCEDRLKEIDRELAAIRCSVEKGASLRCQKEKNSLRWCLELCSQALEDAKNSKRDLFEDVTADTSAFQAVVHGTGEQTTARRVKAGQRAIQLLGSPPDAGFLEMARTFAHMHHESPAPKTVQTQCTETTEPKSPGDEHSQPALALSQATRKYPKKTAGRRTLRFSWSRFRSS